MSAEVIYRLLLRAYPQAFRAEFGREMALLFRDQCREGDVRSLGFWVTVIADVARSAPALRLEEWRKNPATIEVIMKLAAVLTVLLALFTILGAGAELVAGSKQPMPGGYVPSVALAIFANVLLLVAAIAILSRSSRGRQVARLAVVASLVMGITARLLFPWMGIFAQGVCLGLPVVLLIALYWPRRASPAAAA